MPGILFANKISRLVLISHILDNPENVVASNLINATVPIPCEAIDNFDDSADNSNGVTEPVQVRTETSDGAPNANGNGTFGVTNLHHLPGVLLATEPAQVDTDGVPDADANENDTIVAPNSNQIQGIPIT